MTPVSEDRINELISEALYLCKKEKYDTVSQFLVQRRLKIDFYKATIIFNELEEMGVITNRRPHDDDSDASLGDIDKNKLQEFLKN